MQITNLGKMFISYLMRKKLVAFRDEEFVVNQQEKI